MLLYNRERKVSSDMKIGNRTVDAYIGQFPANVQAILERIRSDIRSVAPDATETISYGIPTFDLSGKHLVHFAAFKTHIGFFPTPSGISAFAAELAAYETSKGTVRFPLDSPIPYGLIKTITKYRVEETKRNAPARG